mmetsp:Transcript_4399/g.11110  ORF Transcript_4399/g.11110 Transcript_4399/m.11110 type:complete len:207 (-) Transcript_4399:207-827(-)
MRCGPQHHTRDAGRFTITNAAQQPMKPEHEWLQGSQHLLICDCATLLHNECCADQRKLNAHLKMARGSQPPLTPDFSVFSSCPPASLPSQTRHHLHLLDGGGDCGCDHGAHPGDHLATREARCPRAQTQRVQCGLRKKTQRHLHLQHPRMISCCRYDRVCPRSAPCARGRTCRYQPDCDPRKAACRTLRLFRQSLHGNHCPYLPTG